MTPAKRALLESLIRHARGMLTACEKYLSETAASENGKITRSVRDAIIESVAADREALKPAEPYRSHTNG